MYTCAHSAYINVTVITQSLSTCNHAEPRVRARGTRPVANFVVVGHKFSSSLKTATSPAFFEVDNSLKETLHLKYTKVTLRLFPMWLIFFFLIITRHM